ncbi:MAG: sterol desaturase family protein [Myxococcales bacterium]|nr:sterol desaturase family protein [Myxococcales bacterium]MCB9706326.1 sterol desaturase family protein [Myxococcales bacterium]
MDEVDVPRSHAARRALIDAYRRGPYSPARHLGFVVVFGLSVAALSIGLLRDLQAIELLAVPLHWIVANAAEWRFHRDLLHRRTPPFQWTYDAHIGHHRIFVDGDMAVAGPHEWWTILLPWWAIAALALALVPICGLLALAFGANVGLLVMATSMLYVVSYELLHLSFHLPIGHPIGRLGVIRWLARHHEIHHDPRKMRRYNFNVVLPLWDWVRGTTARP